MKSTMRTVSLIAILCFATIVLAWSKEDHEIFRIRDELALLEGENVSFYDFVGVPQSASIDEIRKKHKKRSLQLHPDKAVPSLLSKRSMPSSAPKSKDKPKKKPGVTVTKGPTSKERAQVTQEATERYALLGTVASVLRGPERERYDHFLNNGFPRWRGSGYYYERLRPGLGSVLFGLLVSFGGAAHYFVLYTGWKRQREFVERYVSHARTAAWGSDAGIPGVPGSANGNPVPVQALQQEDEQAAMPLNRRQKRMQEKDSRKKDNTRAVKTARSQGISRPMEPEEISGPQGSKKKVVAPNGKILIVDSIGNVYLEETTEEGDTQEFLLDAESIPKPTIYQTALFRLPIWAYSQTLGRGVDYFRGTSENTDEPFFDEDGASAMDAAVGQRDEAVLDAVTSSNANGEARKRRAKNRL